MIGGRGEEALDIGQFLNHRILTILHDVTITIVCVCDLLIDFCCDSLTSST